ncbi:MULTISPECIES: hypothetical protein [unclassified Pseudonocardia]|uniref:hypothetical protein n=1 Tax=unclassified Pseudonocardia TaxID=2619320 RepID=UPI0001FFEF90|nr:MULTISPECIES: hypothetical protein [unclassified Pseudonocardia]ALE72210.1 hypothetical protein FRP1_01935 [Pseudonocardia sp. EC080625-04]OLM20701.1 hypothetical protein Ae707Ps1_4960 [Pseudonocardia sp. Ae707_Ps1]
MRTSWNLTLQVVAVLAAAGLRLTAPGWLLFFLVVTIVGLLVPLVPTALSIVVFRRRVLERALAAPFLSCAGFLLLAALTVPDFDDVRAHAPIMAGSGAEVPAVVTGIGMLSLLAWLGSVLWLCVAVVLAHRPSRRPAGPPHPAWTARD